MTALQTPEQKTRPASRPAVGAAPIPSQAAVATVAPVVVPDRTALLVEAATKRFEVGHRKPPVMAVDAVSIRVARG